MPQPLIIPKHEKSLKGRLKKTLVVSPGSIAVVITDDGEQFLSSGKYVIRSRWSGLIGKPLPQIWLVQSDSVTLHPWFTNLLDADGQLVAMDMLINASIEEPEQFWRMLNFSMKALSKRHLEHQIQEDLGGLIGNLVSKHPLNSLVHLPEARDAVKRGMMESLRVLLGEWGMTLRGVTHLSFQRAENVIVVAKQLNELRNALEDFEQQIEIEKMTNQEIREYARREFHFTIAEEAELQYLLEMGFSNRKALDLLIKEKQKRLQQNRTELFDASDENSESSNPEHHNLKRTILILRITFYVIAAITAANAIFYQYFPFLSGYNNHFHLIGSFLGLLLALATLVSVWLVDRRRVFNLKQSHKKHHSLIVEKNDDQEIKQKIDYKKNLLRLYERKLRLIADNCQKAWMRVHRYDVDLANDIRERCVKPYRALANQNITTNSTVSQSFRDNSVDSERLTIISTLTTDLSDSAEEMVRLSEVILQAAAEKDLAKVRENLNRLEEGEITLRRRFGKLLDFD